MSDAFISYRRVYSASLALLLQEKLRNTHNVEAYVDVNHADNAAIQFPERLKKAIKGASVFICLLGKKTLESEWVVKEIREAYKSKIKCVPVFQENYIDYKGSDKAIHYLLNFDGEHISDVKNIHIDYSVSKIARLVSSVCYPKIFDANDWIKAHQFLSNLNDESIKSIYGYSLEEEKQRLNKTERAWSYEPIVIKARNLGQISQEFNWFVSKYPNYDPECLILTPLFTWVEIPEGKTTIVKGGYLIKDTTFEVGKFKISKYPITLRQFSLFVKDGGYTNTTWWKGIEDYANSDIDELHVESNRAEHPCPVTWYEAVAFCRWLSDKTGQNIQLPTEQQWQRASQGDDNRRYPWGNEEDKSRINVGPKHDKIIPVTYYEGKGDSPFGVVDMIGNVFEWCLTSFMEGNDNSNLISDKVMRGGSYNRFGIDSCNNISRSSGKPHWEFHDIGFRIVSLG